MSDSTPIAFIGGGNMAQSLVSGLLNAGRPAETIRVADPKAEQRRRLARFEGITISDDNAAAAAGARLVVLATKPQAARGALASMAETLEAERPTVLSIAAGLRIGSIAEGAGSKLPIVRAMPNTPALVGRGASAWYANDTTDQAGRSLASSVLGAVGITLQVESEAQLDVVTGLSGSGPAYFFLFVEALGDAGRALGLPADEARRLAAATGLGAMSLLEQSGEGPAQLRERVTSPGGTTAAALESFAAADFRGIVARAVEQAVSRARELGG